MQIHLNELFQDTAKLKDLEGYKQQVLKLAGQGNEVTLTGSAPVWLYLAIAHELHGVALCLNYSSPVTGSVEIFNHNPF